MKVVHSGEKTFCLNSADSRDAKRCCMHVGQQELLLRLERFRYANENPSMP